MIKRIKFTKRRILIVLAVFLVLVGLVKYALHYANSPAQGEVSIQKQEVKEDGNLDKDYVSLGNKNFSLLYPAHLNSDLPTQTPPAGITYDYLTRRNTKNEVIDSLEVYLKNLPAGGVTQDADYKEFAYKPKTYKMTSEHFGGELVDVVVADSEMHERSALWVHGDYLLTIKLKSSNKDDLDVYFENMLRSVQWLKN